jgi:hypothetical protein
MMASHLFVLPLETLNIACSVHHSGKHSLYGLDKEHDGVANVSPRNSFTSQKHETVFQIPSGYSDIVLKKPEILSRQL